MFTRHVNRRIQVGATRLEMSTPSRWIAIALPVCASVVLGLCASCGSRTGLSNERSVDAGLVVPELDATEAAPPDGGALVLFGGQALATLTLVADTWSFDGVRWAPVVTQLSPPARANATMATRGGEVVLFGGTDAEDLAFGDTWIFDGTTWSSVGSAPSPPARTGQSMAALGAGVVLFGGRDDNNRVLNDTWTLQGSSWSRVNAAGPPARASASMATLGARVVLFGGADENGVPMNDTWSFDGARWSNLDVAIPPPPQFSAVEAPLNGQLVLFGGSSGSASGNSAGVRGMWSFDGVGWMRLPAVTDLNTPWDCAASLAREIVAFGDNGNNNDTFTFEGSSWSRARVSDGPPARCCASMAYLP
jgi:hypothetical protein